MNKYVSVAIKSGLLLSLDNAGDEQAHAYQSMWYDYALLPVPQTWVLVLV